MATPYVGEIRMGGWTFAPVNWAMCDGSTIEISQNEALFNLIGTTYGGNGQTTFNLPSLLGRVPIHMGTSPSGTYIIGQAAGTETVTLNTQQIPAHSHPLAATTGASSNNPSPAGQTFAASPNVSLYITPTAVVASSAASTAAGGSQPHENLMPFQCVTYIIALYGVYPTQ